MSRVSKEKEMDVPSEVLFNVITDFESYPNFVSEVVSVKVIPGASSEKKKVTFELEIMKRFQYTLEFDIAPQEVRWSLVESNFFKTNEGRWLLKPSGKGKTHATYELEVGFGFLVPGWVTKRLTETSLPKMLDNFEARAKQIMQKKS
jgi:coenzyme Q-binding protein COQ10